MDEIERFGFIPNGGRIYYLNRSQPPLFIHVRYFCCVNRVGLMYSYPQFVDAIQLC